MSETGNMKAKIASVTEFPNPYSPTTKIGDLLRDVARHADANPEAYSKLIMIIKGETDAPLLWTRGLADLESAGILGFVQTGIYRDLEDEWGD